MGKVRLTGALDAVGAAGWLAHAPASPSRTAARTSFMSPPGRARPRERWYPRPSMTLAPAPPPAEAGVPVEPKLRTVVARPREGGRIAEVDALRGLAALVVVFYHYGQRYRELGADAYLSEHFPGQFPMNGTPVAWVPWGHYGVQLFFMISGFVILMTISK